MALDPSIALQAQPIQLQNPLTTYAQVAGIQDAQARNKLLDLTIQDKQREVGQNAALNKAYSDNLGPDGTVNAQGLVGSVAQAGYGSAIPGIQKTLSEAQTAALTQQKSKVENALQQVGAIGQVLGSVTDQSSYDAARQWALKNLGPDAVANMPQQYDPNLVAQKRAQSLTVQQQLAEHHANITDQLGIQNSAETGRHNLATEGNAAGQLAVSQGQLGVSQGNAAETGRHNLATEASSRVPAGYRANPDGSLSAIPGGPAGNLTESQGNALAFGARATDAQNTLRQLEASGVTSMNRGRQAAASIPIIGGALAAGINSLPAAIGGASEQQQSYEQAQRNFVSAVLRKESGAAISDSEYANEAQKYFPQPGDTPGQIEQKARARDLAIEGLKAQAGPGASQIPGIISSANQSYQQQPHPSVIPQDAARAELIRRAQNNPALAARLQAMGH